MIKEFCENCNDFEDYIIKERTKKINDIKFREKYALCNNCHDEMYVASIHDENVLNYGELVRSKNGIITIKEINEILEKYNIGKKPLSLVLGWGEVTIIRYLEGSIPEKMYSDVLKSVLNNVNVMYEYLEKNKDLITPLAYKKAIGRIMEIKLQEDKSKIYLIAKHIIAKMEDITPLALQKILYYIQGMSVCFFDKPLFDTPCEAWVHGPVYRDIYDRFSYYSYNPINKNEFADYEEIGCELSLEEAKFIDAVIDNFGCYSGKTLEKMTHLSLPWLNARGELESDKVSNTVIDAKLMDTYFEEVKREYDIKDYGDIKKYSQSLFEKSR